MGYSENERGEVVLTMTMDDWQSLIMALGFAAGGADKARHPGYFQRVLALTNRLNEGNPRFTPYEVESPANEGAT
jgi:hypothetical protein